MTSQKNKAVLVIIDGLGDRPVAALQNRTPLEAAHTPVMNRLASEGQYGLVSQVPEGEQAHTHVGVSQLFGLDTGETGMIARGAIEAAGLGWDLAPGDIAARINFAHLSGTPGGLQVMDRRAGRIDSGTDVLIEALNTVDAGPSVTVEFRNTEQHRGVLRLSGPGLSHRVTSTDPGNSPLPAELPDCRPLDDSEAASNTARILNQLTRKALEVLEGHPVNDQRRINNLPPANGFIFRGVGVVPEQIATVFDSDMRVAVVAGCTTVTGLARIFGFNSIRSPQFTADEHTDLVAKVSAVRKALNDHDLVYLHVKAPDISAHDRDPVKKRAILERLDEALEPLLKEDAVIAVSADHGTDSNTGWHIDDPVPGLMYFNPTSAEKRGINFGESECRNGPLGRMDGRAFLERVLAVLSS